MYIVSLGNLYYTKHIKSQKGLLITVNSFVSINMQKNMCNQNNSEHTCAHTNKIKTIFQLEKTYGNTVCLLKKIHVFQRHTFNIHWHEITIFQLRTIINRIMKSINNVLLNGEKITHQINTKYSIEKQ